jgi:hypothetical protein
LGAKSLYARARLPLLLRGRPGWSERGCGRQAVVREFVAEVEARLAKRLGAAKLEPLRALLVELDEAL